jgi:hypothetical protein
MMNKEKRHDIFMFLLVIPIALLSAFILIIGEKDRQRHQERQQQDTVLVTLEDSVHFYEDGM